MSYTLPPLRSENLISYSHFPNRMLCFIYRNWEMLTPEDIAMTLETDVATVTDLAVRMGLTDKPVCNLDWKLRGYVTIIRANWHLISYRQLEAILGWDEEKLAYILREDDFLDVKLGRVKPGVPDLLYAPLTAEEDAELARICRATKDALAKLDPVTVQPFDFEYMFARVPNRIPVPQDGKLRYVSSYCALYGDPFLEEPEISFPESLLRAYRDTGITGVWSQCVLSKMIEFPFAPEISGGYQERQKGLRKLIAHLAKYGLKLYLYINEPRGMPYAFFDKYPHMKGNDAGDGYRCMCTSVPEVQEYLRSGIEELTRQAPGLGGYFTITASENPTSCWFRKSTDCPRCSQRPREEVIAEQNRLIFEGARAADPNIRVIAYTWAWHDDFEQKSLKDDLAERIIRLLPKDMDVLSVSENCMRPVIHGVNAYIIDYSISTVGPGEWTKQGWRTAKERGNRIVAKTQFNNSWEGSAVPYLPVFEQVYEHITNLNNEGVDGIMGCWTQGGYPSPTLSMIDTFFATEGEKPTLRQLYDTVFPTETNDTVAEACHLFSEAFRHYPFSIETLYYAPQHYGPSSLFYAEKTNWQAAMVGNPYDDLKRWRGYFPESVFRECWHDLTELWKKGLAVLNTIPEEAFAASAPLQDLRDCAEGAYCHFRSVYLQVCFVMARDAGEDTDAYVKEDQDLALRVANISAHNPTVGYESSNHYYYTRAALLEKYVNCDYLLQ